MATVTLQDNTFTRGKDVLTDRMKTRSLRKKGTAGCILKSLMSSFTQLTGVFLLGKKSTMEKQVVCTFVLQKGCTIFFFIPLQKLNFWAQAQALLRKEEDGNN